MIRVRGGTKVQAIVNGIGWALYSMFGWALVALIDIMQAIFYGFAGIGNVSIGGVSGTTGGGVSSSGDDGGIVYWILQSDLIKNIWYSMLILACILILIFTIVAFLRNIYSAQPKKWDAIIGDAIKGIGMFIVVPIVTLLGVWLGNVVLIAVNAATSGENSDVRLAAMLYSTSTYYANKVRSGYTDLNEEVVNDLLSMVGLDPSDQSNHVKNGNEYDVDYYANLLDTHFSETGNSNGLGDWYETGQINYLMLIGGGGFMLWALISISFGMIKRLFTLAILFVISPAICAMYPLKGDGPVKSWTSEFVKETIGAYSAVAGLNLMFALLPLVQNIQIPEAGVVDWAGILPLIVTIAGLFVVKDIINLISSLIGGANAYMTGTTLRSSVKTRMDGDKKKVVGKFSGLAGWSGRVVGAFKHGDPEAAKAAKEWNKNADNKYYSDLRKGKYKIDKKTGLRQPLDRPVHKSTDPMDHKASAVLKTLIKPLDNLQAKVSGVNVTDDIIGAYNKNEKAYDEEFRKKYPHIAAEIDANKNAKGDKAKAEGDLDKLMGESNLLLRRILAGLTDDRRDNKKKDLQYRAKNGLTYSQSEIDAASPEDQVRMKRENRYIEQVYTAQLKLEAANEVLGIDTPIMAKPDGYDERNPSRNNMNINTNNNANNDSATGGGASGPAYTVTIDENGIETIVFDGNIENTNGAPIRTDNRDVVDAIKDLKGELKSNTTAVTGLGRKLDEINATTKGLGDDIDTAAKKVVHAEGETRSEIKKVDQSVKQNKPKDNGGSSDKK